MYVSEFGKRVIFLKKFHTMKIAGLERNLQLFKISDNLQIAAFILFGDAEITVKSAEELLKLAPDYDILFTAECKSIPLIHEMARQRGDDNYIIARKAPKLYMEDIMSVEVNSITTENKQTLCIGKGDAQALSGKKVLIVDDVISTGESLTAMETLVEKAGGNIVGKMAVLAEGSAKDRDDIIYLEPLPLFDADGNPLN